MKQKEEKRRQLEEEKRRKEEERQRRLEEKIKIEETRRKQQEEERRKKEEEKRKREEERQQKLEEKLRMEELRKKQQEERKRKTENSKAIINNWLIKNGDIESKTKDERIDSSFNGNELFRPMELRSNQSLAPYVSEIAKERFVLGAFDSAFESQESKEDYLQQLRDEVYQPLKNFPPKIVIADVEILEDGNNKTQVIKTKHLQFHENVRPAYHGTWRKRSNFINGRRPFAHDKTYFDYDVDSDDEWEEDDQGESVHSAGSDDSIKVAEDYEIDDEFFVPHGHLSEDENQEDEELDEVHCGQQLAKSCPLLKEQILMAERNKSFKKMMPQMWGCYWDKDPKTAQNGLILKSLQSFKRVFIN